MSIIKYLLVFFIILPITIPVEAAFFEETFEGNATNISEDCFNLNSKKICLPIFVINNIKEGDSIIYGYPEPILIVHEDNKIKYGYGNIFHFSDTANLVNGIKLELLKTKKSSEKSEMVNVTTYFRVTKDAEVKDFSLDPGEYTTIWNTIIAVHRAEEPSAPIEGPQHWYVYEIYTNQSKFSNYQDLNYVKPNLKHNFALAFSIILITILILFIISKRRKIK